MDVEVLKSEKKMILERANIEKRELTQEEKDRCHIIDKQVYDIENGFFNPSGFIKTSVKVNIKYRIRKNNIMPSVEPVISRKRVRNGNMIRAEHCV